ncbi:MAG: hypothetical protein M0R80_02905 [Proteobacteria bacterium]|jgi:hypothetical protein|nr:hypothetical protein [Pseudomonadota bacterium]
MSKKPPPLVVRVIHTILRKDRLVEDSVKIVEQVLTALQYHGTWDLAFFKQSGKRSDFRFMFAREASNGPQSLLIRTMPGGPETCWDSVLTCPKMYDRKNVISAFRRVHPKKLTVEPLTKQMVEKATQSPLLTSPFPPKPRLPTSADIKNALLSPDPAKSVGIVQKAEQIAKKEAEINALAEVDQEVQQRLAQPDPKLVNEAIRWIEVKLAMYTEKGLSISEFIGHQWPFEEKVMLAARDQMGIEVLDFHSKIFWKLPSNYFNCGKRARFCLSHRDISANAPVHHSPVACLNTLAAFVAVSGRNGYLSLELTLNALKFELGIDQFLRQQDYYTDGTKIISFLLKALCEERWLRREYRSVKDQRTKGFWLTCDGMEEFKKHPKLVQQLTAEESNKALAKPLSAIALAPDTSLPEPIHSSEPILAVPLSKVASEMSNLEPLAKQIDTVQESVNTYGEIIEQAQKDLQTTHDAMSGLQMRLDALKKDLNEAENRMQDYVVQETRLLSDVQEAQNSQQEELGRIEKIKDQMRSILGAA